MYLFCGCENVVHLEKCFIVEFFPYIKSAVKSDNYHNYCFSANLVQLMYICLVQGLKGPMTTNLPKRECNKTRVSFGH